MKKKHALIAILSTAMLFSCNVETTSSTQSSASSSTSTSSVSVSEGSIEESEFIRTENLTDQMLSSLKEGYSSKTIRMTEYETGTPSTAVIFSKCNEFNFEEDMYYPSGNKDIEDISNSKLANHYHYQPKPDETEKMLYDVGLSVGNKPLYTPVMGTDIHSYEEIHMTWEEGYYSNVFLLLNANYFERVGDENKFRLNIESDLDSELVDEIYARLDKQLYCDDERTTATFDNFYLLTNGDKVTGYELEYVAVSSTDSTVYKHSYGYFLDSGADVIDYVTPIAGETDEVFEEAMEKLRAQNYHLEETQFAFNFNSERMVSQGKYVADFYNKESVVYDYYNANGKKYMSYAYQEYEIDGEPCKLGLTPIEGKYYVDYAYAGSLEETILPSFDLSSVLFVKDSASTADKAIYKLNNDIKISLDNYDDVFTPFDADGYTDRLIYLTITIEKDKINIHNETSAIKDQGLVLDVNYTKFGEVEKMITNENTFETTEGLTWSQLLSNNEETLASVQKTFTKEILDSIPTVTYCSNISCDISSPSAPVIFFTTYDKDDTLALLDSYGAALVAAGFNKTDTGDTETPTYNYWKNVTLKNRQYSLNISLATFWNSIQNWGQFQISMSFSAAK